MSDTYLLTIDPSVSQAATANEGAVALDDCGAAFASGSSGIVPLYRAYRASTGGHFYTIHIDEYDECINDGSHVGEGIAGYCYAKPASYAANMALYRGYNPNTDDHLYTLDPGEIRFQYGAYQFEGIACYVSADSSLGKPLHRLCDPSGRHFYTTDQWEYANCLAGGFTDEGTCGSLLDRDVTGIVPLYESHNSITGGHFYTTDFGERDRALANGHRGDGIACYVYSDGKQPANAKKLLRAYNSTADSHLYTLDASELDAAVNSLGFTVEESFAWVLPDASSAIAGATAVLRCVGDFAANRIVPTPSPALASSSNYILNNVLGPSCNPIRDLRVQIDIDADLVVAENAGPLSGFSFQVNAQSIASAVTGFQQYVFSLQNGWLCGVVCNFVLDSGAYCMLQYDPLVYLANGTLPCGYQLLLQLTQDDESNVLGVRYQVFDSLGNSAGDFTRILTDLVESKAVGIAPIGSFQVNLVGPAGGEDVTFASGSGRITYAAAGRLRPAATFPSCVNDMGTTAETANSFYGTMPAGRATSLTQTFGVSGIGPQSLRRRSAAWRKGVNSRPPLPPSPHPFPPMAEKRR